MCSRGRGRVGPVADPVLHPVLESGVDSAHRPGVDGRGGLALPYLPYRRLCDLAGAVYLLRRVSLALLHLSHRQLGDLAGAGRLLRLRGGGHGRSEEHTSELQSLMRISYAVFCLKKKKSSQYNDRRRDCAPNIIIPTKFTRTEQTSKT